MSLEEIKNTIAQMLPLQRQIQEAQLKTSDNIARLKDSAEENRQLIQENGRQIDNLKELARQGREDIATLVEEIAKQRVEQSEKFN